MDGGDLKMLMHLEYLSKIIIINKVSKAKIFGITTGSDFIDKYLFDINNNESFDSIKNKIKNDFKRADYRQSLIFVFQKLSKGESFSARYVFETYNQKS